MDTLSGIFDGIAGARTESREEYKEKCRQDIGDIMSELDARISDINARILGRGSKTDAFKALCEEAVFLEEIKKRC